MNSKGQVKGVFMVIVGGAVLVTILTILFLFAMQGAVQSVPTLTYNDTTLQALNNSAQLMNITSQMNNAFLGTGNNTNTGDIISTITTGGYNTLRFLGAVPAIYFSMFTNVSNILGLGPAGAQLVGLAALVVILAVIGLFILLVFRVYII